jgi:hypothetical protein
MDQRYLRGIRQGSWAQSQGSLGAIAFESALLPLQSIWGIANVRSAEGRRAEIV